MILTKWLLLQVSYLLHWDTKGANRLTLGRGKEGRDREGKNREGKGKRRKEGGEGREGRRRKEGGEHKEIHSYMEMMTYMFTLTIHVHVSR